MMIRTIVGLALAGIALTPFAEKPDMPAPPQQAGVDTIETASMSIKTADHYVYEAAAPSGARCRILVDMPGGAMAAAHAEAGCSQVYARLETVTGWAPVYGGNVRLVDSTGSTVVEIGASDGFAYEAVSPAAAQISISEIES